MKDLERLRHWQRRLWPIRLGAEPVEAQLRRRLGVTAVLTLILGAIAAGFAAIFAGFGRADIGLGLGATLILPVVAWAWWDHARLHRRVAAYLGERDAPAGFGPEDP